VDAGIDEIGNEIEEPFSILPLEVIAAKSRSDIAELMNKSSKNCDFKRNIDMSYELKELKRSG
jgi:predicted membrane chloride channel (bestrophin family)